MTTPDLRILAWLEAHGHSAAFLNLRTYALPFVLALGLALTGCDHRKPEINPPSLGAVTGAVLTADKNVRAVGDNVKKAQISRATLDRLVANAYNVGVAAKSLEAEKLRAQTVELGLHLDQAEQAVEIAKQAMAAALEAKDIAQRQVNELAARAADLQAENARLRADLGRANKRTVVLCWITLGVFVGCYFLGKIGKVAALLSGTPGLSILPVELAAGIAGTVLWLAVLSVGLLFWTSLGSIFSWFT